MSEEKTEKETTNSCCGPMGMPDPETMQKMMSNWTGGPPEQMKKMMEGCGCGCEPMEKDKGEA